MRKLTALRALFMAGAAAGAAIPASAYAQPAAREWSIPRQDLDDALRAFGLAGGVDVVFDPGLVRGRRSAALRGRHSTDDALHILLRGTGLGARPTASGGYGIVAARETPASGEARAAGAAADSESAEDQQIVVTGTNIRGIAQNSSPVLSFSRRDIDLSGRDTVQSFLRTIPQNSASGLNSETFRNTALAPDDATPGSGVNLRGLGNKATLVLVNGLRSVPQGYSGSTDISLIPLSVVERIEILTNGASAIYGSDAVGGVVNFILRDELDGGETTVRLGTATEGDGDSLQLNQTLGTTWNGGGGLISYDYRRQDPVSYRDRSITSNISGDSILIPDEELHTLFGSVHHGFAPNVEARMTALYSQNDTIRDFVQSTAPFRAVNSVADSRQYSIAGTLTIDLSNTWQARISANYANSDVRTDSLEPVGRTIDQDQIFENSLIEGTVTLEGALFDLPGGPVRASFGGTLRNEDHSTTLNTNSATVTSSAVTTNSRNISALFGELLLPLARSDSPSSLFRRLELSIAGRYERYSDFGDTFNPKVGLLWEPVGGLALRASYDTSFRAPLLYELAAGYNIIYYPLGVATTPSAGTGGPPVAFLVNFDPDLSPERSKTFTAGLTWRSAGRNPFRFDLNYFHTDYSDRVAIPTPLFAIIGIPELSPLVTPNPPAAEISRLVAGATRIFDVCGANFAPCAPAPGSFAAIVDLRQRNVAETRVRGLDVSGSMEFPLASGRLVATAAATYLFKFDNRLLSTLPAITTRDRVFGNAALRGRATLSWQSGRFQVLAAVDHVDDYLDTRFTPARRVASFTTADASASYVFGQQGQGFLAGTRLALSVTNLFNQDPPFVSLAPGQVRGFTFDPANATARGRFVSLSLTAPW